MHVDWRPVNAIRAAAPRSRPPDETVHAARAAIDADPAAPLDLDALAAVAGYATTHFVRRFARVVGRTPGRYQTARRMELARHLLETTDLDVTTICLRVGYASPGSFSDAFRKAHGRPPTAWRRRADALEAARADQPPVPACYVRTHVGDHAVRARAELVREADPEVRNLGEAVPTAPA